jgi:hypothetical protein
MKFIARLTVIIAALLLAANAAFDLLARTGFWNAGVSSAKNTENVLSKSQNKAVEPEGVFLRDNADKNYFVANPLDIDVEVEFIPDPEGSGSRKVKLGRALIPIRAETKHSTKNWRADYDSRGARFRAPNADVKGPTYSNGFPVWECVSPTYSSLVIYDFATGQSKSVTPKGVAVTSFTSLGYSLRIIEGSILFTGTYVSEDSNGDGVLNCNDRENFFFIDGDDTKFVSIDVGGQPFFVDEFYQAQNAGDGEILISVGIDENKDGVYDPYTESVVPALINLQTLETTFIPYK